MKKVHFNDKNDVCYLYVWQFANREARKSKYIQIACDHERFNLKIEKYSDILEPVLRFKLFVIKRESNVHNDFVYC